MNAPLLVALATDIIGIVALFLIVYEIVALDSQRNERRWTLPSISERYWKLQRRFPFIRYPVFVFLIWLALHFTMGLNAPDWAGGWL
jgi:hypothetical protein